MNANDRAAGDYAHRGQRISLVRPRALTIAVGDALRITFDGEGAWEMPATVTKVDPLFVEVEPGAAVKDPSRWRIVSENAEPVQAPSAATQTDLFAL